MVPGPRAVGDAGPYGEGPGWSRERRAGQAPPLREIGIDYERTYTEIMDQARTRRQKSGAGIVLRRILCVLLVTLLLIGGFLYGVMYMVCK